jgi:hypothetical protein
MDKLTYQEGDKMFKKNNFLLTKVSLFLKYSSFVLLGKSLFLLNYLPTLGGQVQGIVSAGQPSQTGTNPVVLVQTTSLVTTLV